MDEPTQQWETALWNLFVELRKETIESQKIRAQIIGFKISFISAGIGWIFANSGKISLLVLTIPAFAAIFFDFLIQSYTFSIKRIGFYCREHLEPIIFLRKQPFTTWEKFVNKPANRQRISWIGNMGFTTLAAIPAIIVLLKPFRRSISLPLLIALLGALAADVISSFSVRGTWLGFKPKRLNAS